MIDTLSCFAVYDTEGNILFAFRRHSTVHDKYRNASLTTSIVENDLATVVVDVTDLQVRIRRRFSTFRRLIEDGPCTDDFGCFGMHCSLAMVLCRLYWFAAYEQL